MTRLRAVIVPTDSGGEVAADWTDLGATYLKACRGQL
jgi:hypothetical protein